MTKILLLDDEEINDVIFSSILEDETNIEYHYESDGWKALQYLNKLEFEKNFPDFIFVDLNMSEMDGFSFIEYYEKRFFESFPNCKLFILTSSILLRDKEKSKQFPSVISFIHKPITKDKLIFLFNEYSLVNE
jgi:CheY-like chemotaxis protein